MKRRFDNYRRLARGLLSCSSLWVSEANVLHVCGSGVLLPFAEEYHRFDLRRIQSISLVRTHTGLVLSVIFGALVVGFGGVGAVALVNGVYAVGPERALYFIVGVLFGAIGVVALLMLLGNVALGPTCQFQVQTLARVQKIRPVRRLRVGRRVLEELAPMLAQAQITPGVSAASLPATGTVSETLGAEATPG